MTTWNPIGWSLLAGGFLFGVIVAWAQVGEKFWLISYSTMLAGLAVLVTNLLRVLWRALRARLLVRGRPLVRGRLHAGLPKRS
jgi:hypothetical protein